MRGQGSGARGQGAAPRDTAKKTAELLAAYLAHLAHERRLSPHTVRNYGRDVEDLLELAGDIPLARLEIAAIRRILAQLRTRGLDGRTLARMLSAWRGFYRYLAR